MSEQPFFLPETTPGEYDTVEAFKSYWKPEDGSVQAYLIIKAEQVVRKNGQAVLELELRGTGEHANKEPRPMQIPNDPKFLWLFKQLNEATGVTPPRDAQGCAGCIPAQYKGRQFLATAEWSTSPNPEKPDKPYQNVNLRNLAPVGTVAQPAATQAAPALAAAPQPMMQPTPVSAPVQQQAAVPVQATPAMPAAVPFNAGPQATQGAFSPAPAGAAPVRRTIPGGA